MKNLSIEELRTVEGGFPWIIVGVAVAIFGAGVIDGCNNARYETTAKDECEDACQPEC